MKTGVSLKYFVSYCPWKQCLDFNSSKDLSNVIAETFSVTLRVFTLFYRTLEQLRCQKFIKFILVGSYFPNMLKLRLKFVIKTTSSWFEDSL